MDIKKIGDKLVCKPHKSRWHMISGTIYTIIKVSEVVSGGTTYYTLEHLNDRVCFISNSIYNYFYTDTELRKLKLEKIR
jgi:hypothetical protein